MLLARRAEKDFLLRREDRYVKAHNEVVTAIAANIDARFRCPAELPVFTLKRTQKDPGAG